MSPLLIIVGVWSVLAAFSGLLAVALSRAAAVGDEIQLAQVAGTGDSAEDDRRVGQEDRRTQKRPWQAAKPGRRAEDILRQDLRDAHRALTDAEKRLADIEARRFA